MGLRSGSRRRLDQEGKEPSPQGVLGRLGAVRRAQQITTYGVGAMVAIGDQSFLVSGLDTWKVEPDFDIHEPRLESDLHVRGFHLPPASDPPAGDGVRVRRFPTTYSCQGCGALKPYSGFNSPKGRGHCGQCDRTVTPSRFIVACAKGHLSEFPYWEWTHRRREAASHGSTDRCRMKLISTGRTASLRSIVIECSCGKKASLEGAFSGKEMARLGITCKGHRPWFGDEATQPGCGEALQALQRGASAAWFPVVRSALTIPPWHKALMQMVMRREHRRHLVGKDDARIAEYALDEGWLADGRYTPADIVDAVRTLEAAEREQDADPENPDAFELADRLRTEEFRQLSSTTEDTPENQHFVCVPANVTASSPTVPGVEQTMLVKRLREVRALTAFTRVIAPMPSDPPGRRARLHRGAVSWLPAIEVIGEGVFVRLDTDRLRAWESTVESEPAGARVKALRKRHLKMLHERGDAQPQSPVSPRLVLVHTLAHALINEWSLDCGYPAAALRERLYVSDEMAAFLLYTATSDSAGSLGGIIAQGQPDRLTSALDAALRRIAWCSADPLCMEADASGADGLNLAACHACILLPETSCELNNILLDRALLVGSPELGITGYYPRADE
ncbi:DrmB family protein [Streptomyces sp. NPDC048288]|uniref:DrmB family protein n=1 Tax=Streptomyces sp. NPDC048288 TaxID=3365529 RepID=UPI00371A2CD3